MFYCYLESGKVCLVKATPEGCEVISSFTMPNLIDDPDPTKKSGKEHLAHLAIADGKLYVRHYTALYVYDIKPR